MKLKTTFLFLLFFYSIQALFGQKLSGESIKERYEQQTVFWQGNKLMFQGQKLKLNQFKSELLRYEDSRMEFDLYKKHDRNGWIWYGVAVGGIIASVAWRDDTASGISLGVSLSALLPSLIHLVKADKHLSKSIWLYNRDALLENR